MKFKPLFISLLALPFSLPLWAESKVQFAETANMPANVVSFNTEVEKEVERDLLRISLFYQTEGKDLANLNKALAERLNQAVGMIKKQAAVTIKDNTRYSQVRYNNQGKQTGWTVRGELTLESKDFAALSQTVVNLADLLAIERSEFLVSSEKLAELENDLTALALEKFKTKATLIQQSLQMKGYRILDLDLSDANVPYIAARMYKTAEMGTAFSAEENDAYQQNGKEKIKANIRAKIELLNNE